MGEARRELRLELKGRQVEWTIGMLPEVSGDPFMLRQAMVNLLSNAIKHSPDNGLIQINHSIIDGTLRVEVTDEGGGIPLDQRNHLFRRFSHLETTNERARQGAGLGLSVVKEIVEAQQGEVGITDSADGSNSFWFTLRLANGSQV